MTRIILFTLSLAIVFTLPIYQSPPQKYVTLRYPLKWFLYARVQSSAWADSGLRAPWPLVRAQAEPFLVASGIGAPGEKITIVEPVVYRHPCWFHVVTTNSDGDTSAISNILGRP